MSERLAREQPNECCKCGKEADAKVIISSIHDGEEMKSLHGVCYSHLEELGDWFGGIRDD